MPLRIGLGTGIPFNYEAGHWDPKTGNPVHYFDLKHGLTMFKEDIAGSMPVTSDLDPVNYVTTLIGSEPLTGQNGGLQYQSAVSLGSYSGPSLYSGNSINVSLKGANDYGPEETFLLYFYGAGWGSGLKSICGKTGNQGQYFYNGNTIQTSVFNGVGSFVYTGFDIFGGPALISLRHHGDGKTSVSVDRAPYFETFAAGTSVFGKAEFGHSGGAGFGSGSFYYIAGAFFNYIVPDALRDQYFNFWTT